MTTMNVRLSRIGHTIRRRPVRFVEALIILAGALGYVIDPDAAGHILALVALAVGGGEVAQTQTTPLVDPMLEHDPEV